jgi:Holliday junction resolvase RusA-like endonuclease
MLVLDLEGKDLDFASINEKYGYNPKTKKFFLSPKYRAFKELVSHSCVKEKIKPPYMVLIRLVADLDIDNPLKPILDGLEAAGVVDNDKNIQRLTIVKIPLKKSSEDVQSLTVHVKNLDEYCANKGLL